MKGVTVMASDFGAYRLFVENIDHKAIIVRTNRSKKDEIPVGSEIIAVNGQPTQAYREQHVAPYIAASTAYIVEDWSTSRLLQGLEGTAYEVKIKKPRGGVLTLNLVHSPTAEQDVFPAFEPAKALLDFKWYPNRIAYVSLNSFGNPQIDSLFVALLPELSKAKGLVLDLRFNGGGSTTVGTRILQYLTADRLIYGAKSSTRMHVAAYKAWGKYTTPADTAHDRDRANYLLDFQDRYIYHFPYAPDTLAPTTTKILVPTALLIGHNTASAAEDFLIYADKQRHMVKVGENTFGSTGQPYRFGLPGGGEARVCTKQDTYPDGREFVGCGIKPDLAVARTLAEYVRQQDPVLAKALAYLKGKMR
jgi:C-terminal processing protease CtpA/Prc